MTKGIMNDMMILIKHFNLRVTDKQA